MASPTEASRALALGALVRKLRRERRLTLRQLAEMVPMSSSNLSRIDLGAQGPPTDEIIERIGIALDIDPAELLRAAGRYATGTTFEETVLARLDALSHDLHEVKKDVREVKMALADRGTTA
jgi:transcriptional regulator with XRE-family HTH domain